VSRRPDPARIRRARHDAVRNRLIGDGLLREQADRWISAWAERAGEPETPAEFDAAYEWILSEARGRGALSTTSDDAGDGPSEPSPDELREDVDPDLLARWITISGLIAGASTMLERGGGAWIRMSLVAADTAIEAILGLIASEGTKPVAERAHFDDVYEAAIVALRERGRPMPPGRGRRLLEGHRLRNAAIHHGSEPAAGAAARHLRAAGDLRTLATEGSPTLGAFAAAGPVRAVASLVGLAGVTAVAKALAQATDETDPKARADAAAVALDIALSRLHPPLRPRIRSRFTRAGTFPRRGEPADVALRHDVTELGKDVSRRLDLVEAYIIAGAVGLTAVELEGMRRVLGRPMRYIAGEDWQVRRDDDVVLDDAIVERAVLAVTDLIFRMWATDSLRPPDAWD
jgi:hypothetical protein